MMPDFVQHGDADFLDQLLARFAHVHQIVAENVDSVGKHLPALHALVLERDADVQTQNVVGHVLLTHQPPVGAAADLDRDVFQVRPKLRRNRVERLGDGSIEFARR